MPKKEGFSKLKTALLHCGDALNSYYYDWQQAFIESELYDCDNYNLYRLENVSILKNKIDQYDLIIALHSTNASGNNLKFNFPYVPILQKRKGKLVMFVGNEVNIAGFGEKLSDRLELIKHLKPEIVASQLPIKTAETLYENYDTKVVELTHALNPKVFYKKIDQANRKIDFGIRTGKYPSYLGDNDRNNIIDFFKSNAGKFKLSIDINTDYSKKLDPAQWCDFLNSCKGTLGNESGGYFLEKDDKTVMEIRDYVYQKTALKDPILVSALIKFFSKYHSALNYKMLLKAEHYVKKLIPESQLVKYEKNTAIALIDYDFNELYNKFYRNYQDALNGRAISSRHFDAIGCHTCQVLLEGNYNGILKADEHYISLRADFSNFEDCIERFSDFSYRSSLTRNVYEYVMNNHTLSNRVERLYQIVNS